ncbi:MAG: putative rane protein [Proteobacteria bacterium]|nr:putative rane protein [Pseudomonadota bacterium]
MKSFMVIYLAMLGIAMGVEIAAGAFIAPVIFFPQKYLGDGVLSHFQSGILMTQVFLKMNLVIGFVALYSIIYEVQVFMMRKNYDFLSFFLSFLIVGSTGLFLFYYTPFILHAQQLGSAETTTEAFDTMHKQSEWIMKALMVAQFGLFIRRSWLSQK